MDKAVALAISLFVLSSCRHERPTSEPRGDEVPLPQPRYSGPLSVEEGIFKRKSVRSYGDGPLTLSEASQLLWAAGGMTVDGLTGPTRAYPSAGGLYPLEVYLVVGDVEGLRPGIYRYLWRKHTLEMVKEGDLRRRLMEAALGQRAIGDAPMSLVLAAVYERTTWKYGERGKVRYVHMDTGGAVQNVYLQAEALGLGTVCIGAFRDDAVRKLLGAEGEPVCIMPVGRIR
ncbi:MAG TPA: SagB/ThcOx family dehydrogenase [Candidatus Latescibacteria bacterium]|nr:SagB/ThcOx family dehydrogenase [Candidatus Latescibacterota bacterium]